MAQVEQDLRSGHYRNALRQRDVLLEGFRNVKQYLEGEAEVRQDATSNLPTDIQKKSSAACRTPRPPAGRNSTGNTSSGSAGRRGRGARGEGRGARGQVRAKPPQK